MNLREENIGDEFILKIVIEIEAFISDDRTIEDKKKIFHKKLKN